MIMVHGIPRMLSVTKPCACETKNQKNDNPLCHTHKIQNHRRGNNRGGYPEQKLTGETLLRRMRKLQRSLKGGIPAVSISVGSSWKILVYPASIAGNRCEREGVLTKKSPEKSFPGISGW
jgi:hypothetical protein